MTRHGAMQRAISVAPPAHQSSSSPPEPFDPSDSTGKYEFRLVLPFNVPPTPEAAAVRILRNLGHFALYYAHFVWIVLCITLIPERKVSLTFLAVTTYVASAYVLIVRAFPVLNRIVDKHIVLGLLTIVVVVEMILTDAGIHLLGSVAGSVPVVLFHAAFWVREDHHVLVSTSSTTSTGNDMV